MANIKFEDLNLQTTNEIKTFKWGDKEIEVKQYLPVQDKYDLVMITLQKSFEDGIYNPLKLDMYFHLNLLYLYSNIEFSEQEREDETNLCDKLENSGFMTEFLKTWNENEYNYLLDKIDDLQYKIEQYNATAASVLRGFINDLPANAEAAQKIVENFDPAKYQAVVDFAKAANGGRQIPKSV